MVLLGNLIALAASILMVAIGFIKKKGHIMASQCVQFCLNAASNIVLGGYTGAITNFLSIVRNLICMKKNFTTLMKLIFIVLQVVLALLVNDRGFLGWLPIGAAVSYTWFLDLKDEVKFKLVMILGQVFWAIYDITLMNYVAFAFDIFTIFSTAWGIKMVIQSRKFAEAELARAEKESTEIK